MKNYRFRRKKRKFVETLSAKDFASILREAAIVRQRVREDLPAAQELRDAARKIYGALHLEFAKCAKS